MDSTAPPRDGSPAPWPDGSACPLCLVRDVSGATFHFEIEKSAASSSSGRAAQHGRGGHAAQWTTVRCRCCDPCRARVAALARRRVVLFPLALLGTLAWPVALATELPMRLFALERLEAVMLTTLVCAVLVAVPLVLLDRGNRALRANLEASWLFRRLRARVQQSAAPATADAPHGDHWKVFADAPASAEVLEATDLLRS
jgi:hypothetical protein